MKQSQDITAILEQFDAACWKAAHKYHNLASVRRQYEREDLHAIAQMAVVKAVDEYDESKGTKLSTHVINMINWEMGHLIRKPVTEEQRMPTVTGLIVQDEERSDFVHPEYHDTPDDASDLFETLTSSLDERSVEIVRMRLIDDMTYNEMGQALGCSHVHARNLFEQALVTVKSKAASFIA